MKKIWIDMLNPSHPLFFKPLIQELKNDNSYHITIRDRGETVKLAKEIGLNGDVIGRDYENPVKKILSMIHRTLLLNYKVKAFDTAISFENPMSVAVAKIKRKNSILFLDNDLKYLDKSNFFQNVESKTKLMADTLIIPRSCEKTFYDYDVCDKIKSYHGFKEDFYIADYQPDKTILKKLPFENYVIIRGEALHSFYVNKNKSLVPQLFDLFAKENINILFLARDKSDFRYKENTNLQILKEPLNGLDLIYYSDAALTGSGTMAREAACMGKTAVSFFPSNILLSVDQQLVEEGKLYHSRNPEDIIEYILSHRGKREIDNFERSKNVKKNILEIIKTSINNDVVLL
jgi:uncharacterized protein